MARSNAARRAAIASARPTSLHDRTRHPGSTKRARDSAT
jgi:hypothetical protein